MTIRHLKTFIAVCEYGSMTQAASSLHVAQPAVSYTISEIEKYYGIKLFNRINQRISLTEFGEELLKKARGVIESFNDFEKAALGRAKTHEIRIGATLTIGRVMIPSVLTRIKEEYPKIKPFVFINKMQTIEEMITKGKLDFAIVEGEITSHGLVSEEISGDRVTAVCKSDYKAPEKCTVAELCSFPLLLRERGSILRELFDSALSNGASSAPFIESTSNEALISSVRCGLGIALLPSAIVSGYISSGELREIELRDASLERKYYAVMRSDKQLSAEEASIYALFKNFNDKAI